MDSEDEQFLKQRLDELQRDVSKKLKFEPAVAALTSLLRDRYSSASPPLRNSYFTVISRVATVLKTRYTSPGFWAAGLALFRLALTLVSDPAEKTQLLSYISDAEKVVRQDDDPPSLSPPNQGFLFEGHLTVDREPPQPQWLVQSNLLASAATLFAAESSGAGRPVAETGSNDDDGGDAESAANLLQSLIDNLDSSLPPGILEDVRGAPRVPPASKKVVANLPVITITEEKLKKLGEEADCCICKENLVVNDKMQELPCKHTFHPPCLKPWLDEHNSCPICRHELDTDDHAYESWKEREREAEEDRKGAANAVRGGEYILIPDPPMEVTTCLSSSSSAKFGCLYDSPQAQTNRNINSCFFRFPGKTRALVAVSAASSATNTTTSVGNGYVGPGSLTQSQTNTIRNYTRGGSCFVIPPPAGKKPRAIIKFLGGAFIGAVPEVTYSYLTELLAKEGFLVISVPYNVTFDHVQAAHQVYERFNSCLDTILASGLPDADLSPAQLAELPVFSVGHSNGALLQVLAGSYFSDKIPTANAIIAYNNRPATEAVPYFEQLGPLVNQMIPIVEASPVPSMARTASGDAWKSLINAAGAVLPDNEKEILNSFTKFVDQLPSVLNEVTEGTSEFKPTPSENRDFFKSSYNVKHTLLVKFNFDGIDETDTLEETLKPRVEAIGGTLEKVEISGNHITPCFQEPKWQVGALYTPADAIAQSLKTLSLNDVRVLSRTIVDWFRRFED